MTPVTGLHDRLSGVIVKPVSNSCNLACSYCYAGACSPDSAAVMSVEFAKELVDSVLRTASGNRVEFIWHGGEPLLRGVEFYDQVFAYQKQAGCGRMDVVNAIQTNMTLLNQEWVDFLKAHDIPLSTSIDGPSWIHDRERKARDGGGSHETVVSKIRYAIENGIQVNTLTVVSEFSANFPKQIYQHLASLGVGHCGFLPCFRIAKDNVVAAPTIASPRFGQFMSTIFDMYFPIQIFQRFASSRKS